MSDGTDIDRDDFTTMNEFERVVDSQKLFYDTFEYYRSLCFWEDDQKHGLFEACDIARGFWKGDRQWSEGSKQIMNSENRQPTKFNRIKSAIQLISGMERVNRSEIRAVPALKGAGEKLVDVVNPALKYVRKANKSEFWNSQAFENSLITGCGNFEEFIGVPDGKFEEEIIRRYIPCEEVLWDITSRMPDRSDALYCVHWYWMSKAAFEKEYGKKPDADATVKLDLAARSMQDRDNYGRGMADVDGEMLLLPSDRLTNMEVFEQLKEKTVRMVRIWRVNFRKVWKVKHLATKEVTVWDTRDEAQAHVDAALALGDKCKMAEVNEPFVSLHEIAGRKEVRFIADIGIKHIPVKSMYCFFDEHDGTYWGLPYEVKDNQEVLNQIWATLIEVIKQMPKLTYEYEEGSLTKESEERLARRGFIYGLVMKYKSGKLRTGGSRVTALEGVEKLNSLQPIIMAIQDNMQYQTAVRDVMEGFAPGSISSGVGLQVLRQQGAAQLQKLFDNLTWYKMNVAELEIEMLPLLDPDFVFEIVNGNLEATWDVGEDNQPVGVDQIAQNVQKNWKMIFNRIKYTDYQYVLDSTAHNPSEMMTRMQMLIDFSKGSAVPIPPEMAIDNTFLTSDQKEYWKKWIKRQQEQQAAAANAANAAPGA